jgi:hypothetical protein
MFNIPAVILGKVCPLQRAFVGSPAERLTLAAFAEFRMRNRFHRPALTLKDYTSEAGRSAFRRQSAEKREAPGPRESKASQECYVGQGRVACR